MTKVVWIKVESKKNAIKNWEAEEGEDRDRG